jgi:hypothetical protein
MLLIESGRDDAFSARAGIAYEVEDFGMTVERLETRFFEVSVSANRRAVPLDGHCIEDAERESVAIAFRFTRSEKFIQSAQLPRRQVQNPRSQRVSIRFLNLHS